MEEKRLMVTRLPADVLRAHPDNPRKDLGDIEELTESIKANGIMQNLTVIPTKDLPGGDPKSERYTILIGHRRFAAGKAAGVTEFPCCIMRGLSHAEQVAIMLEENIQRTDLTLREQAEGMQMLLDLGESYKTITKKTGFSETTIRHRVNLLKLDSDLFEKKQHQLTLADFAKLESIPEERRDEALKEAESSNDIQAAVERIKLEEQKKKAIASARSDLEDLGLTENTSIRSWLPQVKRYSISDPHWLRKMREDIPDFKNATYCFEMYSMQVCIEPPKDEEEEEHQETKEDILREKISDANKQRKQMINDIFKSEIDRLRGEVSLFITSEKANDWSEEELADAARWYMEMEREGVAYYSGQIEVDDIIADYLNEGREDYEDEADQDDIDTFYQDMATGAKIIARAAEKIPRPFNWSYKPDADEIALINIARQIFKHIPFEFSPEFVELTTSECPLYEEVTEENIDTWDKDLKK